MKVLIAETEFDPFKLAAEFNQQQQAGAYGASCQFVGTMRDFNQGDDVLGMTLEHYPGMTEKQLGKIVEKALQQWSILDAVVVHRVGEIQPGEPIVLCMVWSAHRAEAFEACRYLIEALKKDAPFWKKEQLPDGPRWVEPT